MPISLSSISAKSQTCTPEKRRAYRNFEGTLFGQVTKKLCRLLFRTSFSPIPKTIVVSNTDFLAHDRLSSNEELSWQSREAEEDAQALGVVRGEYYSFAQGRCHGNTK